MSKSLKPIIGIVTRAQRVQGRSKHFFGAFETYVEAVSSGGAEPILIPIGGSIDVLHICDGVVLAGGEDPSVASWWVAGGPSGDVDPARDAFEALVVKHSRACGIPLLALCRGAQLVNCVCGGTLTRHPPGSPGDHGALTEAFHSVRLRPGSEVAAAFAGSDQVEVLCRHSAYIATLGAGLEPSAWASDETIEAFEAASWPCIGAIWHAEWAGRNRAPDLSLFRWLASAARGKRK